MTTHRRGPSIVRLVGWAAGFLAAQLLFASLVSGETLTDAFRLAYATSPSLAAQQASLRALDERFVQARSRFGPQVNVTSAYEYDDARVQQAAGLFGPASAPNYRASSGSADLSLVQPIYTSGATRAAVGEAEAEVSKGREDLRSAEAQVMQAALTAYLDVLRDRGLVQVIKDEVEALSRDLKEITAKGALGALTRTDVAQSQARLLSAQSQLVLALGHLGASVSEYRQAVGRPPGTLAPPGELTGIPQTIGEVFVAVEGNNPDLMSAVEQERAARARIAEARATNGAAINLRVDASRNPAEPYLRRQYDNALSATVTYSQPLYTAGLSSARLKEALEQDNAAQLQTEDKRLNAVRNAAQAWQQLISSRNAINLQEQQIAVFETALTGDRIEERAGQRSTIDLLNAEAELANARISFLNLRHDEFLARGALLSLMGLMEMRVQTSGEALYDPQRSFKSAQNPLAPIWENAIGWADRPLRSSRRPRGPSSGITGGGGRDEAADGGTFEDLSASRLPPPPSVWP